MNKLVFIENGKMVTDSLIVAQVFGKEHKHVIRDINNMECSVEFRESNFGLTSYQSAQNKALPKYILTQDGFSFLAMGYTGKEAARFKEMYIGEFNRMRNELTLNTQQLSPELQMFSQIFNSVARMELEQSKLQSDVTAVKKQLDNQAEILALNPTEWRKKVTSLLNGIAKERGGYDAHRDVRNESYELLEARAKCDLSTRLTNKRRRMLEEGTSKSRVDKVNRMDVIAEDARLTEVYLAIVKEMAIRTGSDWDFLQ
ncbi:Rha family transcriptional regulator [Paenibacillus sp. LX16]|uniref:Rha family transcriptional regulator n=1 Tax=Paenibacillus sp. LX16 TaxID=1740264 RepID=UPI002E2BC8E8|nr:Rha family transcriptional regulator [Paenibacillus sp. LX16]